MKLTIIESPFKTNAMGTETEYREYLNRCIADSVSRGESPYASHKMLTDSLDDSNPQERELGINAGLAWKYIDGVTTVFYLDYGYSTGMKLAMDYIHENAPMQYELRRIGKNKA